LNAHGHYLPIVPSDNFFEIFIFHSQDTRLDPAAA
jgi:hypothetical protein